MTKDIDEVESIEDFSVKPTDNLIVVGQTDDDCSRLDVYGARTAVLRRESARAGFDETVNDVFMHHDIVLSAYPLCLEWINFDPGAARVVGPAVSSCHAESEAPGNLIAVGSMSPQVRGLRTVHCIMMCPD